MKYLYVLLKNNVVITKKVNKTARKVAQTMCMMQCAKLNDCILRIQPWQNEHQQSLNNFCSCVLGNHTFYSLMSVIEEFLAASIGKTDCNTLPAPS